MRCPTCHEPVIATPDGRLLDSATHRLALHRPDGTQMSEADVLRQDPTRPAGHHLHRCPTPRQGELFDGDAA